MIASLRTTGLTFAAPGCLLLLALPAAAQDVANKSQTIIDAVVSDWKDRLQRSKIVKYDAISTTVLTKEFLQSESKKRKWMPRDITLHDKVSFVLDFHGKRHRMERDSESFNITRGMVDRTKRQIVFDSKSARGFNKSFENGVEVIRPDDPDLLIDEHTWQNLQVDANLAPLLAGHGVVLIPPRLEITFKNMSEATSISESVYLHGTGVHDGRPCVVLRTTPTSAGAASFEEYWIDPARRSALVRKINWMSGCPALEWNIRYANTAIGWLVDSWTRVHRIPGNGSSITTVSHSQWKVEGRAIDYPVSEDDFRLPTRPGMLITRFESDGARQFRVDGSKGETEVTFVDGVERPLSGGRRIGFYAIAVLVTAGLVILVWKRRRAPERHDEADREGKRFTKGG
jgi:hypothetical protein